MSVQTYNWKFPITQITDVDDELKFSLTGQKSTQVGQVNKWVVVKNFRSSTVKLPKLKEKYREYAKSWQKRLLSFEFFFAIFNPEKNQIKFNKFFLTLIVLSVDNALNQCCILI